MRCGTLVPEYVEFVPELTVEDCRTLDFLRGMSWNVGKCKRDAGYLGGLSFLPIWVSVSSHLLVLLNREGTVFRGSGLGRHDSRGGETGHRVSEQGCVPSYVFEFGYPHALTVVGLVLLFLPVLLSPHILVSLRGMNLGNPDNNASLFVYPLPGTWS